jgi:VCBS repeat protein
MNRCLWILAFVLAAAAGCRSWDDVRSEFIDPVNLFLHRDHAKAWQANSLDSVLVLYDPRLAADPRLVERKEAVLARFTKIEHAVSIIDGLVQLDGEDRFRTQILLRLRGEAPGGRRLALEEWSTIVCERMGDGWRITEETLLSQELAYDSRPAFSEEAEARGIDFVPRTRGVMDRFGRMQEYTAGSGLAVGDYDGDGHEDVFLVGGAECRLYRNRGDGTFADVTAESLSVPPQGEYRAATFVDYDNDGDGDLFLCVLDAPNLLFQNQGNGKFEEVAARAGLVPVFETVDATFADFNGDGHVDLFLANGGNLLRDHPDPPHDALNSTPDTLYMSNGDGTFTDRTAWAGVGHPGWALASSASDYDLDGDVDLFVANDVGRSALYRNRGDGSFENVTVEVGMGFRGSTMSAAWGDVNGDGYPDLFAPGMDSNSRWMIDQPGFPSPAPWYLNLVLRSTILGVLKEMLHGNRLYLSNGDGTFKEVADPSGVRRNGWAWSGLFLDYDNDGLLDISNVNGFLSGEDPKDL